MFVVAEMFCIFSTGVRHELFWDFFGIFLVLLYSFFSSGMLGNVISFNLNC